MNAPAYRVDGRPATREAFYALACDPQRSVVVEACAGAGKTWMLVSRVLRALLDGAQPQEILAITFTRKAAGEMRDRLNDWLREFSHDRSSHQRRVAELVLRGIPASHAETHAPTLATLHERLLEAGRSVEIRTFHGWFSQLLRGAPLALLEEIGLRADAELIESLDEHRLPVWRRFHAAVRADAALLADHAELIGTRGRTQLRRWLEAAWDKRIEVELADAAGTLEGSVRAAAELWPELAGLGHPAQRLLAEAESTALRDLARALGAGSTKAARDAADGLASALEDTEAPARFEAAWNALRTKAGEPRKLGDIPGLADAQSLLVRLREQIHQHEAQREHLRMVRLARVLLAEFAAYKRERGFADMADLERCALVLLRDATLSGWVQERLDSRIRHVLIDEFQDTSPLQWHALQAWLAGYAGAGGGASGQRPPGVFVVGDPKQSIYRFRRAEPRVFEKARHFVADALGGQLLECDHTRRNAPEVLAALNPLFAQAQDEGRYSGFRAHTTEHPPVPGAGAFLLPSVARPAARRAGARPEPVWRDSLATPRRESETLLREQEAAIVADAIAALLAAGDAAPGEVFVLCRKRQSLGFLAEALRARHVPHVAAEELALMDAVEARDLVALLDALASPGHALSLAQALRSPIFGASDADLVALADAAGEPARWWQALVGGPQPSVALERARVLLTAWQEAATRLPPHDLLDRIVAEGEVRERLAAAVPPERRRGALAAVDALLGQALALDGARYATPYNFVRALKRRQVPVAPPPQPEAVQLLTVHGAKGLEARVVFVMDSDPEPRKAESAGLLIDWPADDEAPAVCAFVYSEARCPASLAALLAEEEAARRREEFNGLYVAITRARERIVFSATQPRVPAAEPSWRARAEAVGRAWPLAQGAVVSAAAVVETETVVMLPVLPRLDRAHRVALPAPPAPDDALARLGQAVHRTLEWATGGAGATVDALATAAAAEFGAPADEVGRVAQAILASPDCATFFHGAQIRWSGNEIALGEAGETVRIDRLVLRDEPAGPVWWVLDYKLRGDPQADPVLVEQLRRYRRAVEQAQPGATVRSAFISGNGRLLPVV